MIRFWRSISCVLLAGCAHVRPIDRAAWTADLDTLLTHIPVAYANFEYSVRGQHVDPRALAETARARIARAHTDAGGQAAIAGLLKAFGDGHVALRGSNGSGSSSSGSAHYTSCKQLGFRSRDRSFNAAIRDLPGFVVEERGALATAHASMDGKMVRAVRIPLFSPTQFPEICEVLWRRIAADAACDDACASRLRTAVGDSALDELASRLQSDAASPDGILIVDITGNGGGSEWAVSVASRLTPYRLTLPAVGRVRHEHHLRALERRLDADTMNATRTRRLLAELTTPCDWSKTWQGAPAPACSPLVIDSGKVLEPTELPLWRGQVVILVDRGTASAAEQFAAMLADAGAARIAGERTMGVGCGFTNGGIEFRLPRSGLEVRLPDCARFRKDGTNERAGVTPDHTKLDDALRAMRAGRR